MPTLNLAGYVVRISAVVLVVAGVTAVGCVSAAQVSAAAPDLSGQASFTVSGGLYGVAVSSARSAWAVGWSGDGPGSKPLILRWDGTDWTRMAGPIPGAGALTGVAVSSARSTWAVGWSGTGTSTKTLILRWDGTTWTRVPSPTPGGSGQLTSVAVAAGSAWAVGWSGTGVHTKTLILRWDGTTWVQVPSPSPGVGDQLDGVAAASAGSVWAVGGTSPNTRTGQTLILRWNGTAWTQVPSPDGAGGYAAGLSAVTVVSARDAWAVGASSGPGTGCACVSLIVHWNGTTWTQVPSPSPGGLPLAGVAAVSTRIAWAVGHTMGGKTVILHWNGIAWSRVPSASADSVLDGVAAASSGSAFAVGSSGPPTSPRTLILRWDGTAWN